MALKGNCVNHRSALLKMMLADGISIELAAEGQPHLYPMTLTHLLTKGRGSNPENYISATTRCGLVPGKWQCVRPVGCPVIDGHHMYILSLLSLCLGSWRSQCWFWDFHNFILFSCIYLAFHNPMWVYGYDFREF